MYCDEVIIAAIEALGKIGDDSVIDTLVSALDYVSNPSEGYHPDAIAEAAVASLRKLRRE